MKKSLACLLLLISAVFNCSMAQLSTSNYLNRKLDNGLQLLFIEDVSKPLISISLVIKEGPLYLNEKEMGLNLLSSMMLLSASEKYPSHELIKSHLTRWSVQYQQNWYESAQMHHFKCYKNVADSLLRLLSDVLIHPVITKEELMRSKRDCDSLLQSFNAQSDYVLLERRNKLFEKYGLEQLNMGGSQQHINSCTTEQFQEYRNKFIRPSNCLLIIHGKFNKFELISKLNQYLGGWSMPELSISEKRIQIILPFSTQTLIGTSLAQYPTLQYCFPGPSYKNNTVDYYAGKVLSTLLNNNAHPFKSGISKRLSIYDFETEQFNLHTQSFFTFTCIMPPEQLQKTYDTLNNNLNKLTPYIRDDIQLADAKRRTYQLYENLTRSTTEYLNTLGLHWANNLLNEYYQAQSIIMKLTAADLQSYLNRYIINKPSARFLLISPAHQDASNSRRFFNTFEQFEDLTLYFDRNSDMLSKESENNFYRAVQFLKINKGLSIEITIYQDADEKKDLVRKRYASLYSRLYAEGIDESILDEMGVNLYITTTRSPLDKFLNQRVVFQKSK